MTGPQVALCLAAVLWFATGNPVVPVLAGIAATGLGLLASRYAESEAWAHIPRRRQDRDRTLPLSWEIGGAVLLAAALAVALLLITTRAGQPDVPPEFRAVAYGSAIGVAVLMGVQLLTRLAGGAAGRRRALIGLPALVTVGAVVILAGGWLYPAGVPAAPSLIWAGALMIVVLGAVLGAVDLIQTRRVDATQATSDQM